jgi:hypothetical protein
MFRNSITARWLTAGVARLGREGGFALETGFRASQKKLKKRAAYPKSGARCVGQGLEDSIIFSTVFISVNQ